MSSTVNTMRRALLVGSGGALGALVRFVLVELLPAVGPAPLRSALFLLLVNLSGACCAGFLSGLSTRARAKCTVCIEQFLLVGVCGGYTSYSGFIALAYDDWADARWLTMLVVGLTLVGCPLAAWFGMAMSGGYPARPYAQRQETAP